MTEKKKKTIWVTVTEKGAGEVFGPDGRCKFNDQIELESVENARSLVDRGLVVNGKQTIEPLPPLESEDA